MANLPKNEVRRLINYLRLQIRDEELIGQFEDQLSNDEAADFLREPEILIYFPSLEFNLSIQTQNWRLHIIPHAHLRIIQRGIGLSEVKSLFQRFVEFCQNTNEVIVVGAYKITGRPQAGSSVLILRIDIDEVEDEGGKAHVVTIYFGQRGSGKNIEFELE